MILLLLLVWFPLGTTLQVGGFCTDQDFAFYTGFWMITLGTIPIVLAILWYGFCRLADKLLAYSG